MIQKEGLFLAAGSGTLFLDEIGELPFEMQSKLLRVLQERQVRPVGSSKYSPVKARIIAATNRDLALEVSQGRFREDLYHRLNVITLHLPPLRERIEDIPALVDFLLEKHQLAGMTRKSASQEVKQNLQIYPWPGNIREIENAIIRAIAMSDGNELSAADILPRRRASDYNPTSNPIAERDSDSNLVNWSPVKSPSKEIEKNLDIDFDLKNTATPSQSSSGDSLNLKELESDTIIRALKVCDKNRRKTAKLMGIGEATLYRKLRKYGIE